ncbi:cathepsin L1-like [Galendromus occidentalis]|uniref:Cathepsin L1-like n=1 Tax=Galendromus occidentalis TaxID=34638 RepID=A0AAJ6VVE5_9ACAR|nr:cathepsin L1-like [Galendromus occidentalis]
MAIYLVTLNRNEVAQTEIDETGSYLLSRCGKTRPYRDITMFFRVAFVVGLWCLSSADWASYKRKFNKNYSSVEDAFRRQIYEESTRNNIEHNILYDLKLVTWRRGPTMFSDMTAEERSGFLGALPPTANFSAPPEYLGPELWEGEPPASVDYRTNPCLTPPKDQGASTAACSRNCWAFATIGLLEFRYCAREGTQQRFSEKYLVNCADNRSCEGGHIDKALEFVIEKQKIPSEASYPYTLSKEPCREPYVDLFDMKDLVGYEILHGDEALLRAVAFRGPVAVYMWTNMTGLQDFTPGEDDIFSSAVCDNLEPGAYDHAVMVVGYGSNAQGKYWIIRNSWGPLWGQHGYAKISRDKVNHCHISDSVFVPKYA